MIDVENLKFESHCVGPGKTLGGSRLHFPVRLRIYGPEDELSKIEFVTYELHPSFKKRLRYGTNRARYFEVIIRTWGFFDVNIVIVGLDGQKYRMTGRVTFDPDNPTRQ